MCETREKSEEIGERHGGVLYVLGEEREEEREKRRERVKMRAAAAVEVSSVVEEDVEESERSGEVGVVHENEEQGTVVSVRDSFGFIRCVDREGQLFFHVSELVDDECMPLPMHLRKMTMTALVNLGDEVAFKVIAAASTNDGAKPNAIQVRRLPPGTIRANREVAIECEQVKGKVVRELRGVKASAGRTSTGYGGVVSYSLDGETAKHSNGKTESGGAVDASNGSTSTSNESEVDAAVADRASGGHTEVRLPFTTDCIAEGVSVFRGQFRSGSRVVFDVVRDRRGQRRVARLRPAPPAPPSAADAAAASHGANGTVDAGTVHLAAREYGVISSIRDTYGFIRCADREGRIFFHVSALVDISENMLRPGLEVSFCPSIEKSHRGNAAKVSASASPAPGSTSQQQLRTVAMSVKAVPRGTVSFVKKLQEKVEGVVEKAAVAPRSQEQMDGVIVYKTAVQTELSSAPIDASGGICSDRSGESPTGGDEDPSTTEGEGAEADASTTAAAADGTPSTIDADASPVTVYEMKRITYGCHSVDDPRVRLGVGDKVSFSILVDRGRGGGSSSGGAGPQYHAVDIVRTAEAEKPEGSKDFGIRLRDRDMATSTTAGVPGSVDRAEDEDAVEDAERQLGIVTSLRMNFGFIRCCDRKGPDLFFHFTAVDPESVSMRDDGTPNLRLGDNLEFSVRRDKRTEKDIAANVKRVAKGTAVFDTIADRVYEGICKEPAQKSYMSGKSGSSSSSSSSGRAGTIEYFFDADDLGEDEGAVVVGDCPASSQPSRDDAGNIDRAGDGGHADVAHQTVPAAKADNDDGKDDCGSGSASTSTAAAADVVTKDTKDALLAASCDADAAQTKEQDVVGVPSEDNVVKEDASGQDAAARGGDADGESSAGLNGEEVDANDSTADMDCTPQEDAAVDETRYEDAEQSSAAVRSSVSRRVTTISFTGSDVKERMFPRAGDDVIFQIATDKKTGKLRATNVAVSHKYGTVSVFKSTYGFVRFKNPKTGYV